MSMTRRSFLAAAAWTAARPSLAAETFVRVSTRNPCYLELTGGSPYIPIGLNLIAPGQRDESAGLRQYEGWLDKLSAQGGNYVRVWLSNEFWDVEHAKSGEYDEAKARRIEAMLEMARRRGIRVKMTLEHFRSIGEGPQKWADKPIHHVSNGGPASSIADFFDGEKSREQFKRKLAWFAKRFGDRPEVFGWELWNEINAVRGGDYMAWTEIMLAELHKLFPRNLCMQSLGSFDMDRVRPLYRRHSLLSTNDVAQVHRYLDLGAALEICHGPMDLLTADSVREIRSYEVTKPVILAESGAVEPRHTGPLKLYAADKEGMLLHDILFAPFFAGSAGCGQTWHWDAYVERNDLWWHFGRFAEFVKGLDPAAEAFLPSLQPHPRLRVYRLDGRQTTLIWCRDPRNDWRSELERGEAPERLAGLTLEEPSGREPVRAYNPWSGTWEQIRRTGTRLALPDFRRSIALRLG